MASCGSGQKNATISVLTIVIALCAGFSIWYWGFDGQSYFYPTEFPLPTSDLPTTTTEVLTTTTEVLTTTTESPTTTTEETTTPVPT
jgi:hypothetical protein